MAFAIHVDCQVSCRRNPLAHPCKETCLAGCAPGKHFVPYLQQGRPPLVNARIDLGTSNIIMAILSSSSIYKSASLTILCCCWLSETLVG